MCEYTKEYMTHNLDGLQNVTHVIDVNDEDIALLVGKKKSRVVNLDNNQSIVIRYKEKDMPVNDRTS